MHTKKYITGINGLRSFAVIGVIFYHLMPQALPGGYLGVPLFFVISGYLMTSILLREWENKQRLGLKSFYFKRIRRLYPPLIILFIVTGAVFPFLSRTFLTNFKEIILTTFFNVNNWWQIGNGYSYFDRFNNESPFTHLWSLSVEGQFYIIWPIVLGILLYKIKDYKKINIIILLLAAISSISMAVMYSPETIDRVYYGTVTRFFSILIGSSLAFYLNIYQDKLSRLKDREYTALFIASFVLLIFCYFTLRSNLAVVYEGGMVLFSIVSAMLLGLIILVPRLNDYLTNPLLHWIGTRSYDIYLWQLPVMVVYSSKIKWNGENPIFHQLVQITIILILSELSYSLVIWIRKTIKWRTLFKTIRNSHVEQVFLGAMVVCLLFFGYGVSVSSTGHTSEALALQKKLEENKEKIKEHNEVQEASTSEEIVETESSDTSDTSEINDDSENPSAFNAKEQQQIKNLKLGAVGDSLLLSASPSIQELFPQSYIDAEVGRQLIDSEPVFKDLEEKDKLGDVVLVVLGTNGSFEDSDIKKIMTITKDRPVFFVNTMVDRVWQKSVNDSLVKAESDYENAHVIDWKTYSSGNYEWFDLDGVHLVEEGSQMFSQYIAEEILKTLNEKT